MLWGVKGQPPVKWEDKVIVEYLRNREGESGRSEVSKNKVNGQGQLETLLP